MPKEKNTEKKFLGRVLGPDTPVLGPSSWAGYTRHHTLQAERKEHREPVLEPSSWAEFLGRIHQTSHITSRKKRTQRRSSWAEFLGRVLGPDVCVSTLCVSTMCEHSMCVSTLTISHITSRKKRTQRRSSWAEFLGRMAFSPRHTSSHLTTSDITSRNVKKARVFL